jgi:hypothetical protein
MKAFRNLIHFGVLAVLAVLGGIMTIRILFQVGGLAPGALAMIAGFWMWFAAYAGGSTALLGKSQSAFMAPLVHGGLYVALHMVPREMPLGLLRIGYDLLAL